MKDNNEMSSAQIIGVQSDWIKKLEAECRKKDEIIAQQEKRIIALECENDMLKADREAERITQRRRNSNVRRIIVFSSDS